MKFSDSILAMLFGFRAEDDEKEEAQNDSGLTEQHQEEQAKEQEEFVPAAAANELILPMEHALNRLYDLREEQFLTRRFPARMGRRQRFRRDRIQRSVKMEANFWRQSPGG